MSGPVENDDGHVGDVDALGLGHRIDVPLDGFVDVDGALGLWAHGDLVHVEHRRRIEHRAALTDCDHGDRVGPALGHQRRAVDGVDSDVTVGAVAVTDLLAVVEHRGLVLLALADDHHTTHRHRGEQFAHGVDRGLVATVLVATPNPTSGGQGRGLGDANQLHREVAIRCLVGARGHGSETPRRRRCVLVSHPCMSHRTFRRRAGAGRGVAEGWRAGPTGDGILGSWHRNRAI